MRCWPRHTRTCKVPMSPKRSPKRAQTPDKAFSSGQIEVAEEEDPTRNAFLASSRRPSLLFTQRKSLYLGSYAHALQHDRLEPCLPPLSPGGGPIKCRHCVILDTVPLWRHQNKTDRRAHQSGLHVGYAWGRNGFRQGPPALCIPARTHRVEGANISCTQEDQKPMGLHRSANTDRQPVRGTHEPAI